MLCAIRPAPTHPVQLRVEAAGVAHRLAVCVSPPQCGGGRVAVGATEASTAGRGLWMEEAGVSPVLGPTSTARGRRSGLRTAWQPGPSPQRLTRRCHEAALHSMIFNTAHFTFGPQFPHQ